MDRFKFEENSSKVTLPYSVDYLKLGGYYIVIDGHGIRKENYLYAKSRKELAKLVYFHWSKYNYGFWVEMLVKNSKPNENNDISTIMNENFINAIEDSKLLQIVYENVEIDLFLVRAFVNNKHTPSNIINDVAKQALKMDKEVITSYTDVFQSALCKPSYTKKFIKNILPDLHKSYAETLLKGGLLSPANKLLVNEIVNDNNC